MDACRSIHRRCRTRYLTLTIFEIFYASSITQKFDFNIKEPFQGLFTQGMVCHETYKDENNNWLSPDEVITIDGKKYKKSNVKKEIKIGP